MADGSSCDRDRHTGASRRVGALRRDTADSAPAGVGARDVRGGTGGRAVRTSLDDHGVDPAAGAAARRVRRCWFVGALPVELDAPPLEMLHGSMEGGGLSS